ncbi:uncharacterized protein LOC116766785 [Danaus plexippus]|uniref:Spaetzle 1-2 n=1 Tax=Danaus plexippus plexippus TaxID=278856 RepID=A0A212F483_DANPL|nr:uncharacterized protein LOC116766779 [Danaus plexippus plexippus]XP_032512771.1 uncharacterized protein LOC116766785 [Danaus plexippus]OWR48541.1 spaetzle 1-2 [Danaus plexippus plexippus]
MISTALVFLVASQCLVPAFGAVTGKQKTDTHIQFPEAAEALDAQKNHKDVPISCKGQNYCTVKTDDYPEDKFNEMFKGYNAFPQPKLIWDPLQNKQGSADDENDCASEISYDPLYKVKESGDKPWRTVVQAPKHDFVQKVRLEKCVNTDASCFTKFSTDIYTTHCKQTYGVWEVLVSKGDNQTELIKAELPICCSCYYAKTPLILSRIDKNKRQ